MITNCPGSGVDIHVREFVKKGVLELQCDRLDAARSTRKDPSASSVMPVFATKPPNVDADTLEFETSTRVSSIKAEVPPLLLWFAVRRNDSSLPKAKYACYFP